MYRNLLERGSWCRRNLADLYLNKSNVLFKTEEYNAAIESCQECLVIREEQLGSESKGVADACNNIGTLYYNAGRAFAERKDSNIEMLGHQKICEVKEFLLQKMHSKL